MNITLTTPKRFSPIQQRASATQQAGTDLSQADPRDTVSISKELDSQGRGDRDYLSKVLRGMVYGGAGAVGGGAGGAVISAVAGASGWGVALSTVGGLVAGGLTGIYLGSR